MGQAASQRAAIRIVTTPHKLLRLGTRWSLLARTQSQLVANELMRARPGLVVELVVIKTTGDRVTDRPLAEMGGKGLFTKEIEQALLDGQIDLAVHSYKDVPVTMPLVEQDRLTIAAVPKREDPRDVIVLRDPTKGAIAKQGVIGTSSLRRQCQVLALSPQVVIKPLRGNIDTRIKKLHAGEFDAIILALAGLKRANLFDRSCMVPLDPSDMLPAPGQGALALQCRADDASTRDAVSALDDPATQQCVNAERELVRLLDGDCQSPIAALAESHNGKVRLRAAVGARGGKPPVLWAESTADLPLDAASGVAQSLETQGVRRHLHGDA
jgi:hydroxymethylbilane synthase